MPQTTIVETERLILREQDFEDIDSLMRIYTDPVAMTYYPSTKTLEEAHAWMERIHLGYREDGHSYWGVILKLTGEHIGQCGLLKQETGPERLETEIGYMFQRAHWGNGYATEAARACRDIAFTRFDKPHVISLIDPRNQPSINVALRVGMTKRERIFKWYKDVDVYEIRR